jgi:hypothetical protein
MAVAPVGQGGGGQQAGQGRAKGMMRAACGLFETARARGAGGGGGGGERGGHGTSSTRSITSSMSLQFSWERSSCACRPAITSSCPRCTERCSWLRILCRGGRGCIQTGGGQGGQAPAQKSKSPTGCGMHAPTPDVAAVAHHPPTHPPTHQPTHPPTHHTHFINALSCCASASTHRLYTSSLHVAIRSSFTSRSSARM